MQGESEVKEIRLQESEFFLSLLDKGYVWHGYHPEDVVTVTAMEGAVGDWAAYSDGPEPEAKAALGRGRKLPKKAAASIFPEWASRLKYRE